MVKKVRKKYKVYWTNYIEVTANSPEDAKAIVATGLFNPEDIVCASDTSVTDILSDDKKCTPPQSNKSWGNNKSIITSKEMEFLESILCKIRTAQGLNKVT